MTHCHILFDNGIFFPRESYETGSIKHTRIPTGRAHLEETPGITPQDGGAFSSRSVVWWLCLTSILDKCRPSCPAPSTERRVRKLHTEGRAHRGLKRHTRARRASPGRALWPAISSTRRSNVAGGAEPWAGHGKEPGPLPGPRGHNPMISMRR